MFAVQVAGLQMVVVTSNVRHGSPERQHNTERLAENNKSTETGDQEEELLI